MTRATRPRVLMPVYNGIEFDGRVRRTADAVSGITDVTVVSLATENPEPPPAAYRHKRIRVPSARRFKLYPHIVFWTALALEAIRTSPDVVHAHDYFLAFPGWVAARLGRSTFVYDAHELIIPTPDTEMSRREAFWYKLEAWAVARADLVIAANPERAALMQAHYRLSELPTVVRNIPPATPRGTAEHAVPQAGPDGVTRLIYQGDVELERGIGAFVDAVATLGPAFELIIVGHGPHHDQIRARAERLGSGYRVRVFKRVPQPELKRLMAGSHLGIISYSQTGLNNIYCAPNKLYEYARAGIPMVAAPNPVLHSAFTRYGIGIDGDDLVQVIRDAAKRRDELTANLPAFLAANTWEAEASTLRGAYDALLRKRDLVRRRCASA